jgi:predicted RNA-binding protein with PIN domain
MKTENTPKKISKRVPFKFKWIYGVELSKIKADVLELERLGATHLHIYDSESHGETLVVIEATSVRLETEAEVKERIKEAELQYERERHTADSTIEALKRMYNL